MSCFLGVDLQIINQDLINLVTAPGGFNPIARVDLYDVDLDETTEITDVKSFSITRSVNGGDSFSLVVGDASTWNARTTAHSGELAAKKNYWFKFYGGYTINGSDVLVPYFVGVGSQVPEDYGPSSEAITITGYGLDYLLSLVDGGLTEQTDDIAGIIQALIDTTSLPGSALFLPANALADQDINNDQALQSIDYLCGAYTLSLERHVNNEGVLVIQEKQEDEAAEYAYDDEIVMTLNRTLNISKLITICTVRGDSAEATATVEDESGYLDDYGRKIKSFSNNFITSSADAETLAQAKITESINKMQQTRFKVPFNPYLCPGIVISLTENIRSLTDESLYIESLTMTYTEGRESSDTITGYFLP